MQVHKAKHATMYLIYLHLAAVESSCLLSVHEGSPQCGLSHQQIGQR